MNQYSKVIERIAERAYNSYMNGSYDIWKYTNFGDIAFIYGTDALKVESDAVDALDRIKAEYYALRAKLK